MTSAGTINVTVNGEIRNLPVALGIMLIAAYRAKIIANYKQPLWLTLLGLVVVATMIWMGYGAIMQMFMG